MIGLLFEMFGLMLQLMFWTFGLMIKTGTWLFWASLSFGRELVRTLHRYRTTSARRRASAPRPVLRPVPRPASRPAQDAPSTSQGVDDEPSDPLASIAAVSLIVAIVCIALNGVVAGYLVGFAIANFVVWIVILGIAQATRDRSEPGPHPPQAHSAFTPPPSPAVPPFVGWGNGVPAAVVVAPPIARPDDHALLTPEEREGEGAVDLFGERLRGHDVQDRHDALALMDSLGERFPRLRQKIVDTWCDYLRDIGTSYDGKTDLDVLRGNPTRAMVQERLIDRLRHRRAFDVPDHAWSRDLRRIRVDRTILVDADFTGCEFGDVEFTSCRFAGDTVFIDSVFSGHLRCADVVFDGTVDFRRSTVRSLAFERVLFTAGAFFDETTFELFTIDDATFARVASFHDVTFAGPALFGRLGFTEGAVLNLTNGTAVLRPESPWWSGSAMPHRWPDGWTLAPREFDDSDWGVVVPAAHRW